MRSEKDETERAVRNRAYDQESPRWQRRRDIRETRRAWSKSNLRDRSRKTKRPMPMRVVPTSGREENSIVRKPYKKRAPKIRGFPYFSTSPRAFSIFGLHEGKRPNTSGLPFISSEHEEEMVA